ncbi:MAG TPA: CorA family divalent cation transporter [Thermoanaerobaculia bacterium]|nr:CorA family divalent cation transporter [Thermoanaerobaculia bacterium]
MSASDFDFHGVSFHPSDTTVHRFGYAELDAELQNDGVFSWIDIQSSDISHLNEVLRRWEIDLILVNQFNAPEVLPRIVERSDCLAFYLYEVVDPDRHLDTSLAMTEIAFERMILILGSDFVITYHQHPLAAVEYVKESCVESFQLAGRTPGFIAFLFLQRCLYDYAHLNLANDNFLDALHSGVETRMPHAEMRTKINLAGRNILTLKKLTASLHIILMILVTKRNRFISDGARVSFAEMLQTAVATRAAIDSSRDLLDGIIGSIQSAAASRTSEIARVLTVVSAIILPLSLIAGIYGMNFENMPELHHPWGYFLALLLMGFLALYLIVFFRRLGWIGKGRSS